MISYGDFIKGIRSSIWTYPGEAKSLVQAHDRMFLEAMIDLCKWIPCLQENHTEVNAACSTYVQCGLTVFDAPYAEIERVYTIANGDWCSKINYERASYNKVQNWSQRLLRTFKPPLNAGLPALQQGLRYPDATTDSEFGRSRAGIWTIHRGRMYLAPWLQSNEAAIVEWGGVKTDWKADDLLDETYWTPDVARAIKQYVQWQHQKDFGYADTAPGELNVTKGDYLEARADLIYWCEQRTKEKMKQVENAIFLEGDALPTVDQLKAEAVPAAGAATPTVFALMGDFGDDDANEAKLAALVNSWGPAYLVTAGDNWYGAHSSDLGLASLDAMVGKYFSDFIFPYSGSYGAGAAGGEQKFFPCVGNHDRDPSGRLATFLQYFGLTKPYYTVVQGPVQFFFVDAGYDSSQVNQEPDGVTYNSTQGQWLQAQLALSTATFKVVVLHQPPYCSTVSSILVAPLAGDGTLSYPALRWPFKVWGADLVISGHAHNYERLVGSDGMIYVINGAGGRSGTVLSEPAVFKDPPLAISVLRYNSQFGAQKCSVSCTELKLEFFDFDETLVDTVTISK